MHRDITQEELEFWLDGEKYAFVYDDEEEEEAPPKTLSKVYGEAMIVAERKRKKSGCTCKGCGDIFPYAEPNQEDGSFKCWNCRR